MGWTLRIFVGVLPREIAALAFSGISKTVFFVNENSRFFYCKCVPNCWCSALSQAFAIFQAISIPTHRYVASICLEYILQFGLPYSLFTDIHWYGMNSIGDKRLPYRPPHPLWGGGQDEAWDSLLRQGLRKYPQISCCYIICGLYCYRRKSINPYFLLKC